MKIGDYKTKDGLGVICLMLPLLLKWLLPPGIETKLYHMIGSINIFIPNILLLFAPLYYKRSQLYFSPVRYIFILWCIIETIVVLISPSPNALTNIFCNTFLFGALYLGIFHRFSTMQIRLVIPLLAIAMITISAQLIILSTGLVKYDLGDVGSEFAGIFRVYTTAGESNGSGDLIAISMMFLLLTVNKNKSKIIISIIATIGIFFTVSRAPIAAIVITFAYFWIKYFRKRTKYNLLVIISVISLYGLGVFDPIIARNEAKTSDGDITSGRDILIKKVLKDVEKNNSQIFGLGVGNVYQSTEVIYSKIRMPYAGAPHNSYVLMYAEQGALGVFLFAIIMLLFFVKKYKYNKDTGFMLFVLLIIIFNTETVISVNSDYIYAVAILMLLMNAKQEYKLLS